MISEIQSTYQDYVASWRAGNNARVWPDGGESPDDVAARGIAGLTALGVLSNVGDEDAQAARRVVSGSGFFPLPNGSQAHIGTNADTSNPTFPLIAHIESHSLQLVVAHGRFNKIVIAALQGDVSRASDINQGNTCVNVLDVTPEGRVDVRALDVRDHMPSAQDQAPKALAESK